MPEIKKISVKLMPPSTQDREIEKEKYYNTNLASIINNAVKTEWSIQFIEVGYNWLPIYEAHIYHQNMDDFKKIESIILTLYKEIDIIRIYPHDFPDMNFTNS